MLSDYQTRVLEGLNARSSDLIAVRQLAEAVRQVPTAMQVPLRPPEAPEAATPAVLAAWNEVEATLRRLQALERCHTAFGRAPTDDLAESPPIRRLYAQQLRVLQQQLHGLAGTPVEGYIAEDAGA
jgi:hypothetical protein